MPPPIGPRGGIPPGPNGGRYPKPQGSGFKPTEPAPVVNGRTHYRENPVHGAWLSRLAENGDIHLYNEIVTKSGPRHNWVLEEHGTAWQGKREVPYAVMRDSRGTVHLFSDSGLPHKTLLGNPSNKSVYQAIYNNLLAIQKLRADLGMPEPPEPAQPAYAPQALLDTSIEKTKLGNIKQGRQSDQERKATTEATAKTNDAARKKQGLDDQFNALLYPPADKFPFERTPPSSQRYKEGKKKRSEALWPKTNGEVHGFTPIGNGTYRTPAGGEVRLNYEREHIGFNVTITLMQQDPSKPLATPYKTTVHAHTTKAITPGKDQLLRQVALAANQIEVLVHSGLYSSAALNRVLEKPRTLEALVHLLDDMYGNAINAGADRGTVQHEPEVRSAPNRRLQEKIEGRSIGGRLQYKDDRGFMHYTFKDNPDIGFAIAPNERAVEIHFLDMVRYTGNTIPTVKTSDLLDRVQAGKIALLGQRLITHGRPLPKTDGSQSTKDVIRDFQDAVDDLHDLRGALDEGKKLAALTPADVTEVAAPLHKKESGIGNRRLG